MRISLGTQKAMSAVFPLFCTKTQILSYVQKEELPIEPADFSGKGVPSSLALLCAMRRKVDFYKSSSVLFVLRALGILGVLGVLFYFYFVNPYIHWTIPTLIATLCFVVATPFFLEKCMNVQVLLPLYHLGLQRESWFNKWCAVIHGAYLLLAFLLWYVWQSSWFWSMTPFVNRGLSPKQVSSAVNTMFLLVGLCICGILMFSLLQSYRKNVLYFSISYHSVAILWLLYVHRGVLSQAAMPPVTSEVQKTFVVGSLGVYLVICVLYTAMFVYQWRSAQKEVHSMGAMKCNKSSL